MSDTVFTKVDYDLNSLVKYIEMGIIGLPDIQRPFYHRDGHQAKIAATGGC